MPEEVCPRCRGTGYTIIEKDGLTAAHVPGGPDEGHRLRHRCTSVSSVPELRASTQACCSGTASVTEPR